VNELEQNEKSMFGSEHHYFPNFDSSALSDFAIPFCQLMFAYANLDREITSLVCSSIGKSSQEVKFNRGKVDELGEQVKKFIFKHGGDVSQMANIKGHLSRASASYTLRNDLAHGHWWKFDLNNKSVSVRRDRRNNERFVEVTVADIKRAISEFEDVELELFKIRRKIEGQQEGHGQA
jgi:hypothetical protein